MKLIPILFSTPMVQAILSGNKSMTRRTKGLDFINEHPSDWKVISADKEPVIFELDDNCGWTFNAPTPYGQPGDVLWVRETFEDYKDPECDGSTDDNCICGLRYKAISGTDPVIKWKPNIHMPFEACRIFLRVKENRVERLHDISIEDAKREGVKQIADYGETGYLLYTQPDDAFSDIDPKTSFKSLWVSINGADSWNSNPWVWVIAFERITDENEIAAIRKQWNEKKSLKTN